MKIMYPLLVAAIFVSTALADVPQDPMRVFVARKIITMDESLPEATAVAVAGGRIVSLGSLDTMKAELEGREHEIDETFKDKVLLPGFIDNHLHPVLAALLLPSEFITPFDWTLPGRQVKGVRGREAYLRRLGELERGMDEPADWLITWGYHQMFHGDVSRTDLDAISQTRPILVMHRSFHEHIYNSAGLQTMGVSAEDVEGHTHINYEQGHFYETGLQVSFTRMAPVFLNPKRYLRGLELGREVIHMGGITTVCDQGMPIFNLDLELLMLKQVMEGNNVPCRTLLIGNGLTLGTTLGNQKALETIDKLPEQNTHRIRFLEKQVKLFSDGAFYSQLMQLRPPGYLDGHHGAWIMTPEQFEAAARLYWNAGYQIHVHVNGDLGVKTCLDTLEDLLRDKPRFDHRFTLHHFGNSTNGQSRRVAALGAIVSANPFYLYALGDAYAATGLGHYRASQMVRLGSLVRNGVSVSLHSDFAMAPAEPLTLAWIAVNRVTAEGTRMAPDERISVQQALRAITIDAAHALRLDGEIGSIAVGKTADFTVLEEDPLMVDPMKLKDIKIWGTVFEGQPFPLTR